MTRLSELVMNFLLNAAWQITAITIVAAIGARLLNQAPARYRHTLWVAALFLSISLPLWSLSGVHSQPKLTTTAHTTVSNTREPAAMPGPVSSPADSVRPAGDTPSVTTVLVRRRLEVQTRSSLLWVLTISYLLFICYRLLRLVRSWRQQLVLRRTLLDKVAPLHLEQIMKRCRTVFRLERATLGCSSSVSTPVTVGAFHPQIVLPESLYEEAREETLLSVVGHEMAHVARRDFAINLMCELVRLFISFHPCSQLIKRQIDRTREIACDELVTERLLAPEDYARSLVRVAHSAVRPPSHALTLSIFDADILEERIMKLTQTRPRLGVRVGRAIFVTVSTALFLSAVTISTFSFDLRAATKAQELAREFTAVWPHSPAEQSTTTAPVAPTQQPRAAGTRVKTGQTPTTTDAQERAQAACDAGRNQAVEKIPMLVAMLEDDREVEPLNCSHGRWSPALQSFKRPSPGETAAIALASMGRPAFEPLVRELGNSNASVRRNAAWAIGELTNMLPGMRAGAVPQLVSLLSDSDTWVRMAAARSLGEVRDERAGESLISALSDSQWQVRQLATWALSEMRDERAVKSLCNALLSDAEVEVRRGAAEALGEIRSQEALAALKQALNDSEPRVRAKVSWAISEIEDNDG